MEMLITPFGIIKILIDGKEVPYFAKKGTIDDIRFPDILGRYEIIVSFVPDGKQHRIACIFEPNSSYERYVESGERLECQGFYNDRNYKMSIGVECEQGSLEYYDYDVNYLVNGMSYQILPNTKTERYVFGIAWIDNVDCDETVGDNNERDTQTWFAADPT